MYRTLFFVLILLAASCTNSTSINNKKETLSKPEYVIDDSLSNAYYINMNSYIPKEGLIPTADIAVKIAQCVLTRIYGKEIIEEEKPFSVNLKNEIWIIEGSAPRTKNSTLILGGQSYMEIRKSNGEILKLLHTK